MCLCYVTFSNGGHLPKFLYLNWHFLIFFFSRDVQDLNSHFPILTIEFINKNKKGDLHTGAYWAWALTQNPTLIFLFFLFFILLPFSPLFLRSMDCPTYLKVHGGLVMIPKRGSILTQRRKNRAKRVGRCLFPLFKMLAFYFVQFTGYWWAFHGRLKCSLKVTF